MKTLLFEEKKCLIRFSSLRVFAFVSFLALLLPVFARSQTLQLTSHASLAEKIYLQLDNKVYTTGQTIWFKAIVATAAEHMPGKLSGVLYIELIDPYENIVDKKLVKLGKGVGEGFFELRPGYADGYYQLRAYTEWNKNFGQDFFFKEYILVSKGEGKFETNVITNLTVVEGENNDRRLNVSLSPLAMDTFFKKHLTIFLTLDDNRDTVSIKKNKSNQYLLDYKVPENCQVVTLQVESNNSSGYSRTIVLDTNYLDFQLFPESGELVQGLAGILGIKAVGYNGKGKQVSGEIINAKGKLVAGFQTNLLGMGQVVLDKIDTSEKYAVSIQVPGSAVQKTYPFPAIAAKGNILSVRKQGDLIKVKASSNYLNEDSVVLQVSCRGVIYYDFKGRMRNGNFEFTVPSNLFPEGIIDFTLLLNGLPVAERLYFNKRLDNRLKIEINSDKETYTQREETKLSIETYDSTRQSVPSNLSVLVFNKTQQGNLLDYRQNILSYFLLASDLKGEIENPGFYFAQDTDRFADLDALLMTQGWRKYNYTKDPVAFRFSPEPYLTVSGTVKGGLSSNQVIRGGEMTLMTFGKKQFFDKQNTDSLGRFVFPLFDESDGSLDILIQSANKSSQQKNYTVTIDKKESPPVQFNHIHSVEKPDNIVKAYVERLIENKGKEDDYRRATGGMMQEVIVKTYAMTPERKKVTDLYGKPKTVIEGDEIRAREAKWSYGLYSVLMFNFPDKVRISRLDSGFLYASLYNGEATIVVIDGIVIRYLDYSFIPNIPPSEVKSFEIIEYADNWTKAFCEFKPPACGINPPPPVGNIIAIYTYAGKGLGGIKPPTGVTRTKVPFFSSPREFYAPKYNQLKSEDWQKPDVRNLIHWAPKLTTDSSGKTTASFYNSDHTGTIQVIIEAISEDGQIGYKELQYEVKKR